MAPNDKGFVVGSADQLFHYTENLQKSKNIKIFASSDIENKIDVRGTERGK